MKSLKDFLEGLGFSHKRNYYPYSLWMEDKKPSYTNTVMISKDSKGYSVETAVIMRNAVKETKYEVKTIKEVKQIVNQDLK